jgi:hypothetical protein
MRFSMIGPGWRARHGTLPAQGEAPWRKDAPIKQVVLGTLAAVFAGSTALVTWCLCRISRSSDEAALLMLQHDDRLESSQVHEVLLPRP